MTISTARVGPYHRHRKAIIPCRIAQAGRSCRLPLLLQLHFEEGTGDGGQPYASLAFYWKELHRSVRVCGRVEKLSAKESKEYYDSRPLGSRVGAWASPQSQPIASREELEGKVRAVEDKFGNPGAAGLDQGKKYEGEEKDVLYRTSGEDTGSYRMK